MHPSYDRDFYGWTQATVALLKQGKYQEVDMDHIIEELEEMGGSHENQLINRLAVLIAHLMKWQFQPDFRSRSWSGTIKEQRNKINRLIKKNPSLKPKIAEALLDGFEDSKSIIEKETPIDMTSLPKICPYTFEQIVDDAFYPSSK